MNIGFIFPKDTILKYNLTTKECIVLDWLVYFMDSGSQEYIDKPSGRFYWVSYQKLIQDLGDFIEIHNVRSTYGIMNSLITKGLLSKIVTSKNYRKRVYFRFNPYVKQELRLGVKNMPSDPFGLEKEALKISGLHPEVLDIMSELSSIAEGIDLVFKFKHPNDGGKVTKSILKFNRQVLDIYQGFFTKQKYRLDENFIKRNKRLISPASYEEIKSCKGNWEKVKKLLVKAAKNYSEWFSPKNQPLTKDWLPRDLSRWMYEERNGSSLFIACIMEPPETIGSVLSDKVVDNLPEKVYAESIKFKDEFFHTISTELSNQFWFSINNVFKLENMLRKKYSDDYMVSLWLGNSGEWTCKYIEWLKTCWGENTKWYLMVRHIGSKGKPWEKWIFSDEDLAENGVSKDIYEFTVKQ